MPESDEQRTDRASKLAFAAGRREAEVDARLSSHEARLNAINGSIERHAKNAAALRESIEAMNDKIDGVVGQLATAAAVEQDRVKQIKRANEKQITGRTFWLGVAAVVVPIMVLIATILKQAHGL